MKLSKKTLLIILAILLLVAIPLTITQVNKQQEIRQRAAEQSKTISFDPNENYGPLTTAVGLKVPVSIDDTTHNNIIGMFPNGGIYLKIDNPDNSILASNNFKSLDNKGFKWYFSFADSSDNNIIPFLQSFFQQFDKEILVQVKNHNNVTLINNIHTQFPKAKIQAGNISGASRDQIRQIFTQTPPPAIDAMGYETLRGGSNVYDDFQLMFDTLYDITTDRLPDYKLNYPANANFSVADVPVGFSDRQQAISYFTGIASTAVVTSIQANKAPNTAPIKYFILGTFTNSDPLKNALITKFINDITKANAVLVWPWAIIENGEPYWNNWFPPEKSNSKPIVGIIGKAGNDYYSLLTNMSNDSVTVNFTPDMNFPAYKFYSSQKGTGNFAASNQIIFAPFETMLISKTLDTGTVSVTPTITPTPPMCQIRQAVCKWDALVGVTGYHVKITETGSNTTVTETDVNSSATQLVFSAQAGKSYRCSVSGKNTSGNCQAGPISQSSGSCAAISVTPTPTSGVTPTITPTPTPRPTVTPTPRPTLTPTPTLRPTVTPTPTFTPTPTPTVTPTPTPTLTPTPQFTPTPVLIVVSTAAPVSPTPTFTPTPAKVVVVPSTPPAPGTTSTTAILGIGGIILTIIGGALLFLL